MRLWIAFGTLTALLVVSILTLYFGVRAIEVDLLALPDAARDGALRHAQGILTVATLLAAVAVGAIVVGCAVGAGILRTQGELRASRQRLRATLASIGDAVITTDADGRLTDLNPAAEDLTGWASDETANQTLTTVFRILDAQSRQPVDVVRPTLEQGGGPGSGKRQDVLVRRDGTERRIEDTLAPILDDRGRAVGIVVVFHDVTERRRTEASLLHSERALVAGLRVAARRNHEVLAVLAHELRNPLAAIDNALARMRRGGSDAIELDLARDTIGRQVRHLVRLVEDLDDVHRLAHGKLALRKERVELAAIVRDAVEIARPGLDAGAHELTVTLPAQPVYLDADGLRLVQVFSNLLGNAGKYSEPQSPITLRVERQQNEAVISVTDAGIGIPPNLANTIFDLFVQLDRPAVRTQEGLGIGLALVRRFVTMHGGSVHACSDGPGRGSTFVVRLPVLAAADTPSPVRRAIRAAAPPTPSRRVLVVDDDPDSAAMLAMILQNAGHTTHAVHDGLAATAAAATFRPDVVLLDLGLPGLDGREAARRIRQQPHGERMMLVALTGQDRDDAFSRFQATDFDHHLLKPVDLDALLALVAKLPQVEAQPT